MSNPTEAGDGHQDPFIGLGQADRTQAYNYVRTSETKVIIYNILLWYHSVDTLFSVVMIANIILYLVSQSRGAHPLLDTQNSSSFAG